MNVAALVLGAGRGARLGAPEPKSLARVAGRSLLDWSVAALRSARGLDAVLCVVPAGSDAVLAELRRSWREPPRLLDPVIGGDTRQASLRAGLDALATAGAPDWVLVHDAARCLVEPSDAERVLAAARAAGASGAAIPVIPVPDTVKRVERERVLETLDRSALALAQTPQAFRTALLREALETALRDGFSGTDCASLVERLGVVVVTVPGRRENWKVTEPGDLERAAAVLRARGPLRGSP